MRSTQGLREGSQCHTPDRQPCSARQGVWGCGANAVPPAAAGSARRRSPPPRSGWAGARRRPGKPPGACPPGAACCPAQSPSSTAPSAGRPPARARQGPRPAPSTTFCLILEQTWVTEEGTSGAQRCPCALGPTSMPEQPEQATMPAFNAALAPLAGLKGTRSSWKHGLMSMPVSSGKGRRAPRSRGGKC